MKSYFWDPLGDPSACGPITDRLDEQPQEPLYLELAKAAASHPIAYAEHRLRHWNSSERWLVPPGLPEAGPPDEAEPNDIGLANSTQPADAGMAIGCRREAATPWGWPIAWSALVMSIAGRMAPSRRPCGRPRIVTACVGLSLEASFLVISIASDLRYHLWPMRLGAH